MDARLESDLVEVPFIAEGGFAGPARFRLGARGRGWAAPYSRPPWTPEETGDAPPVLRWLRGDFFGFPFGATEGHPHMHGETANREWTIREHSPLALKADMALEHPPGSVTKRIALRPGHRALYFEHRVRDVAGRYNYGHHPILQIPENTVCPVRASPFRFASTYPGAFADPEIGERQALRPDARFERLDRVPLDDGGFASVAEFPVREDAEDLVMITPEDDGDHLGWTAITFPGFVWIALRDPRQFPSTLLWMSHGGRPQPPWNGRHRRRIGVEDVCSHFHDGAHISAREPLRDDGIPTSRDFGAGAPADLRHIQFVHPVDGQPGLAALEPIEGGAARLTFEDGQVAEAPVAVDWVRGA